MFGGFGPQVINIIYCTVLGPDLLTGHYMVCCQLTTVYHVPVTIAAAITNPPNTLLKCDGNRQVRM